MSAPRMAVLSAVFLLAEPSTARSQQVSPVSPGDRVRVNAPMVSSDPLVGSLVELTADTCVVTPEYAATAVRYPMVSITEFEVSQGLRSNTLRGLGIGFAAGATLGIVWGLIEGDDPEGLLSFTAGEKAALGAVVFGGIGGIVGAVAGALTKTERWREVPLDQLGVTLAPQSGGGLSVGLRITR